MIGTQNVKQALGVDVAITELMMQALQKWSAMYVNKAPWVTGEIRSMNLAATISSEIARAVTIEMNVELSGSARAVYLAEQLKHVIFNIRQNVEFACAKGGMMLKPFIAGKQIHIDYVQADQFYPVNFDANQNITACIFADQRVVGSYFYTRLEFHKMEVDGCVIKNAVYRSTTKDMLGEPVSFDVIPEWANLQPEAKILGVDRLLVAYFRYPMANNIDPTSPLGVSCFSRAVDLIQRADEIFSNLLHEVETGKRALYVDELAFGKHPVTQKPMLPNNRLYKTLKTAGDINGKHELFEDWSPTIRQMDILASLNAVLQQVEFNCGLAQGTISDPNTIALTATEIKMSKQRTYATVTDAQKVVENVFENLLYAMNVWATIGKLAPTGTYAATYDFDDSVVADHDTQFSHDSQAVGMQVMPKHVFLERNYALSEADAMKWIAEVEAAQPEDFFAGE